MKHLKKYSLAVLILISTFSFSQDDSLIIKKSRFKTSKSVIVNSILSVPTDFVQMGKNISQNWKRTGLVTAGILGLIAIDKPTTNLMQKYLDPTFTYGMPRIKLFDRKKYLLNFNSDMYITNSFGLMYLGGLIENNEKIQQAAINGTKSMIYSYVVSHMVLKTIFARNRPNSATHPNVNKTDNPWDFFNFHPIYLESNHYATAFPSFHATFYFSFAQTMAMEFDNYWIPYTTMTFLFMSKFASHQHWVSDMVLGGIIGNIIARGVVKGSRITKERREKKRLEKNLTYVEPRVKLTLLPQISRNNFGMGLIAKF